jgi:chemotaxis signal transduction protein
MSDVYERLRESLARLDDKLRSDGALEREVNARILQQRTQRIAQEPVRVTRAPDTITCMVFERSSRRYGVKLDGLEEVGPMGQIAPVPGTPEFFLGIAARRGRIVAVVDLPLLFGSERRGGAKPRWIVTAADAEVVCAVAADELHNIVDVPDHALARAMPSFPVLVQRHTVGVLEDRTVVLDLGGLLADRALRVEERG